MQIKKLKKKQKIKVKMQRVNEKLLATKGNLVQTMKKRPKMNYERIRKPLGKKIGFKKPKNWKNKKEITACEQKITSEKANLEKASGKILSRKTTRSFAPLPVAA